MLRASQFRFPKYDPRHIVPPQHLNQRNSFRTQLKNLKINNRNWLFFVRQVLIYFTLWGCNTYEGPEIYFLSIETWNTGCTCEISGGKANQYVTRPILSSISRVQCISVLTSLSAKAYHPFIGDTFKNTSHQTKILNFLRFKST